MQDYPTAALLLSPDSIAIIRTRADEVEVENLSVEVANANARRTIRIAFQQKLATIEDVSAGTLLRLDRGIHISIWGHREYSANRIVSNVTDMSSQKKLSCGGGASVDLLFLT